MRKDYDIVGSYNNQRISNIDCERTVNMFEYIDPLGKKGKSLISTSGLANSNLVFPFATNGHRAQFVFNNEDYVVIGSDIYRINSALVVNHINAGIPLPTITGHIGIDANQFQIIFVDGSKGFIWDTRGAGIFLPINDTSFPGNTINTGAPIDACYIDGFFIVAAGGTNGFLLSSINEGQIWGLSGLITFTNTIADTLGLGTNANFQTGVSFTFSANYAVFTAGTTYYAINTAPFGAVGTDIRVALTYNNAINGIFVAFGLVAPAGQTIQNAGQLQQGFITSHPGNIVACRTLHRFVFLFSTNYVEVWYNQGEGTNLPLRRQNSMLIEVGTPAIGSIRTGFDRMFFLSQDKDGLGAVMEVRGTNAVAVSNRALDFALAQYASDSTIGVSDAQGILIKENGLIFYRLNFTQANHTYVLNVSMSTDVEPKWHEEEMLLGNRHVAQTHGYFGGKNYYGSYLDNKLYEVDTNFYTNDGETIKRMRISRPICPAEYQRTRIDRFHLDLVQGYSDNNNIFPPQVLLSISKDGGQSYLYNQFASMGDLGEKSFRTVWRKLGVIPRGQAVIIKITFFYHIPFVILGAAWDYEVMPE